MIDVQFIVQLQTDMVLRWHRQAVDNPYDTFQATVCQQHSFNYLLWHEEDIARSRDVTDAEIARVKRSIDRYNQQRNDWIEKIDDAISLMLKDQGIQADAQAPMNTETPGSTIDRLSILSLRIYHLKEQLERHDVDQKHRDSVQQKVAICLLQQHELSHALQQLLEAIFSGQKRHRVYHQLKMYNDATLNPYLYRSKNKRVA